MRNPIRTKNLKLRFWPFYLAGAAALALMRPSWPSLAAGLVLIVAGAALRAWGAGHLVKTDRLTVTGPYAHVRHPLYAGTLLIASGFSVSVGGWLAVGLLGLLLPWFFLVYFPRKERVESERLERLYGAEYVAYRENVPALFPSLRPWRSMRVVDARWSGARFDGNNELGTVLALAAGLALVVLRTLLPL